MSEPEEAIPQEALDALLAELGEADASTDSTVPDPEEAEAVRGLGSAPGTLNLVSFDDDYVAVSDSLEGFERVQDIPLEISVELGRTRLLIKDILELGVGSIIELEKMAGEPVDLLANGLLIARGEVVVIEDNFGVRITEIITAADRTEAIKDERNSRA